ncbi:hypothetical protein [Agarivorans sp. 1_MG-2023]|uniref:hypothetical protein n=1 Tax=Agarivorans sp. 1_MG-2023 TaxID=3062634 RepID=UPI0026E42114|nr:hypothetical protein [Agarivorans sp. 1_MG-2023]MDO6762535.1 hypothetical protein [Agarivorans sp. 1_MG-2023]
MKFFVRFLVCLGLAIVTQVGAISYLLSMLLCRASKITKLYYAFAINLAMYALLTVAVVPYVAPLFGRESVVHLTNVKPLNMWLTVGLNRNYVVPELNNALIEIAGNLAQQQPALSLNILDANFPFLNRFPLLPHLSHNDGRKIDLSYVYQDGYGKPSHFTPSVSGYGVFEWPGLDETNTSAFCRENGYFQYNYSRYLTLGQRYPELSFSNQYNKQLIETLLKNTAISKIFIEPHLVERLHLDDSRIRFHGCKSVRHDDHIHIQI